MAFQFLTLLPMIADMMSSSGNNEGAKNLSQFSQIGKLFGSKFPTSTQTNEKDEDFLNRKNKLFSMFGTGSKLSGSDFGGVG